MIAEHLRLEEVREQQVPWKKWGPYLSERQWGTVREDYSEGGDAWNYGDDFTVACPTGSGQHMTLYQVAQEITRRLTNIFLRDQNGRRPVYGGSRMFQEDPHWRDCLLFYEYFHDDNGPVR